MTQLTRSTLTHFHHTTKTRAQLRSTPRTMQTFWILLLTINCLFGCSFVSGYTIVLGPHEKQCYVQALKAKQDMGITYQVSDGGHLDIDFVVTNPQNQVMYKNSRLSTDSYRFTAEREGQWKYCFSNEFASVSSKSLSFHLQHVEDAMASAGASGKDANSADSIDPLEREVVSLGNILNDYLNEQQYLIVRERVHRATAESTNSRVLWWFVIQTILLVGVRRFWQTYYLKRFFEVKRVV